MTTWTKLLLDTLVGLDPLATTTCPGCGMPYRRARPGREPSLECPYCGCVPDEEAADSEMAAVISAKRTEAAKRPSVPDAPSGCPIGLDDVIGNPGAVLQIRTALDAHKARLAKLDGRTTEAKTLAFPSTLLTGVGGTGKSTLARIIAREVNRPFRLATGQSLSTPARVAELLMDLKGGEVLFIDELHGLKPPCMEMLYLAMEDGMIVPIATRGGGVPTPVKLPPFTLIGATTDKGKLLPPLLQRFRYCIGLERLTVEELAAAIIQRAKRKGWRLEPDAARMIAERAHGTPRLAVRLLENAMDTAQASGADNIDSLIVESTCEIGGIDCLGLDRDARRYLGYLKDAGGPVRLNVLAAKLDTMSKHTVENQIEPDLVWLGLIEKNADGRRLTPAGREHLKGKS